MRVPALMLVLVPIHAWNGPLVSRKHLSPLPRPSQQRSACTTSCAVEQDEDDAIDTLFAWMDDNGDGVISRQEYLTHFDRIDGDGNGSITKEEFRTGFWVLASQGVVTSESIARRRRDEKEVATAAAVPDRPRSAGRGRPRGDPVPYAMNGTLPAGLNEAAARALPRC